MSVKFEVNMTERYMYDFMLYHTYSHASGLLSGIMGVVTLGVSIQYVMAGDMLTAMPFIMATLMFLVMTPSSLKTKARMQVKTKATFQKPLKYELTEEGIKVSQDELETVNAWSEVTKAVSTGKSVILYLSRVRALIFPKECMGEQYEAALKMIHTHMPPEKVKIRHIH